MSNWPPFRVSVFNDSIAKNCEVPTARAISERIAKIRSQVKNPVSGSVPSTPRKRKPEPATDTPRTPKMRKTGDKEGVNGWGKKLAANTGTREESDGEGSAA